MPAVNNRKTLIPVALAALVIVILLPVAIWIGVTGDNRGTSVKPNPTTEVATVAGAPAPQGATVIRMVDFAFQPNEVIVQAGQPITFQNSGQTQHEVFINSGDVDSSPMDPGKTFTWTPRQAGIYSLRCRIHPNQMSGQITVR